MNKRRKPLLTRVVPVKMNEETYERLQRVSAKTGEADSTIIRLVLRAGLTKIEAENFELFAFEEQSKKRRQKKTGDSQDCPPVAAVARSSSLTAARHRYQKGRERFKGAGEEDIGGLAGERGGSSKKFSPGSE